MKVEPASITVYTAVFGNRDCLSSEHTTGGVPFRAIVDKKTKCEPWEVVVEPNGGASRLHAREVKTHPWKWVETEYSIWIDGSVRVCASPVDVVKKYLTDCDMAVTRHDQRDCLYDEANVVIKVRLDQAERVNDQMARYKEEGFPRHYGLAATWILVRRHTSSCRKFCEAWWEEVSRGSVRDQLSFDYCRWKLDFPVSYFNDNEVHRHGWKQRKSPSFRIMPHGG